MLIYKNHPVWVELEIQLPDLEAKDLIYDLNMKDLHIIHRLFGKNHGWVHWNPVPNTTNTSTPWVSFVKTPMEHGGAGDAPDLDGSAVRRELASADVATGTTGEDQGRLSDLN